MSAMAAMALGGAGCVAAGGALAFLTRLGIALFAQAVGIVLLAVAGFTVLVDGAPVGAGFAARSIRRSAWMR